MKRSRAVLFITLTFLWIGVIFSFSLQPAEVSSDTSLGLAKKLVTWFLPWLLDELAMMPTVQLEMLNTIIRKCAHFSEFMILGIFSGISMCQISWRRKFLAGVAFCMLTAAADETLQLFIDGRAGKMMDVLIDSAGAITGVGIVLLMIKMKRRKTNGTESI